MLKTFCKITSLLALVILLVGFTLPIFGTGLVLAQAPDDNRISLDPCYSESENKNNKGEVVSYQYIKKTGSFRYEQSYLLDCNRDLSNPAQIRVHFEELCRNFPNRQFRYPSSGNPNQIGPGSTASGDMMLYDCATKQIGTWKRPASTTSREVTGTGDSEFLGRNFGCAIQPTQLRIQDLLSLGNFLPIIPNNCTTDSNGLPIPLNPVLIGHVISRLFGFIASLVFYLLNAVLIFSGLQWIWGGVDGKSAAQARKNLLDVMWAFVILIGAYLILSTLIGLLGVETVNTDLSQFFFTNTSPSPAPTSR